jgi:hypothetical protein
VSPNEKPKAAYTEMGWPGWIDVETQKIVGRPWSSAWALQKPDRLRPIDRDILGAVKQRWDGDDRWVNEILDKPDRMIERRMERLIDRGYLECGVSTRTAWLTQKGLAHLRNRGNVEPR